MLAALAVLVSVAAVAWACVPSARVSVTPTSGPAGTQAILRGSGFPEATAQLSWQDADGSNSQPLPPHTVQVGESQVEVPITIPANATPGEHLIEMRVSAGPTGFNAAPFLVTVPAPPGGGGSYQVPNPFTGSTVTTQAPTGTCQGRRNTKVGTGGRDVINGTAGADVISALGGNDVVRGRGGADRICGGSGNDRLSGGSGSDRLAGSSGNDRLTGSSGNDRLSGSSGNDRLSGGSGSDRLSGGSGRDRLTGSSGRDKLSGGGGRDRLSGGGGKDRFNGGSGTDLCIRGSGDWATRSCE